jgi:pimeloyl-ACP methyl ester carboxylesterase
MILLPGLDGTGKLFAPLLMALAEFDYEIIALPEVGGQDYQSLTAWVRDKLPQQDFFLVAESFSGPIAAALAGEEVKYLKGIIFVATFLSPPDRLLINLSRFLPIRFLVSLPLAVYFHKLLFLGRAADKAFIRLFQSTVSGLPSSLIKARLTAMLSLPLKLEVCDLPVVYIQARADNLVSATKANEFSRYFKHIALEVIDGPHFILQTKPIECASIISGLAHKL